MIFLKYLILNMKRRKFHGVDLVLFVQNCDQWVVFKPEKKTNLFCNLFSDFIF